MPFLHRKKVLSAATAIPLLLQGCGSSGTPPPSRRSVLLGTTTSVQASGLLETLLPPFTERTGIRVDTVAAGTGRVLELGRAGEVDLLLAHAPQAEQRFMEEGCGAERRPFLKNRFWIVGPPQDPAGIRNRPAGEALRRIVEGGHRFVSRADDSGTHQRERELWKASGSPLPPPGKHLSVGQGMGPTLVVAGEKQGYTLTDSGTFLSFRHRLELEPLVTEDAALDNIYSVILLDPERFPEARHEPARQLADWLTGPEAAKLVNTLQIDGTLLFNPIPHPPQPPREPNDP
jgi:tungstate transport system substrate-binding protein